MSIILPDHHYLRCIQALLSDPLAQSAPDGDKNTISVSLSENNLKQYKKQSSLENQGTLVVPFQSREDQDPLWSHYSRPFPVVLYYPADPGDPAGGDGRGE